MRKAWFVAFGLVATAAACGGSDDDTSNDDADGGGQQATSSSSGSSGAGSTSGGGGSSGTSSGAGSSSSSGGGGSSGTSSSSGGDDLDGGDTDGDAGDEPDADAAIDAGPSFVYRKYDLNHLLVAGQSNALGIGGGIVLDTTARGGPACSAATPEACASLMFSTGVFPTRTCQGDHNGCRFYEARSAFAPLREGDTYFSDDSYALQTPGSSLGNQTASLASSVHFPGIALGAAGTRTLVSNHARSGTGYICLRKGGCPTWWGGGIPATVKPAFTDGIDQVTQAKALADARAWSYAVRGVFVVHGENNHVANRLGQTNPNQDEFPMTATNGMGNTTNYTGALLEWQRDYETAITAITAQTVPVPMFITQMNNWTSVNGYNSSASVIPQQQLAAFRQAPEKVVLVTPTYPFAFTSDKVHLAPEGSRRVGEYFAKAYAQTTFAGRPWAPLYPLQVTRAGAVITVRFHVPAPPLVFDTLAVTDPNGKYGFVFADGGANPATIQTVALSGDSVSVTLDKAPVGANPRLRYASDGTAGASAGPTTGARGNLRDSDDTRAESDANVRLVNWSVAFDEAVP